MKKKVSLKVVKAFFYLERSDLLEDRREYSLSDIERAYPFFNRKESKGLYNLITLYFSTKLFYL